MDLGVQALRGVEQVSESNVSRVRVSAAMTDQPPGITYWIYLYLEFRPSTAQELALAFGISRGRMAGLLASMETAETLLSEDSDGRLFVFEPAE